MALSFRRWRPRHLLLAWSGYWLALALVTLGAPLLAIWRMSRRPGSHGSVAAGFENAIGTLSIVEDGASVWSGSASLPTMTLWLVGPPLLLWLLWLMRSRASEADDAGAAPVADTLRPDTPRIGVAAPHTLQAPLPAELDGLPVPRMPGRPSPTPRR